MIWVAVGVGAGLLLAQAGVLLALGLLARRAILTEKQRIVDELTAFVTAPAEGGLSPLAELTELIAHRFSHQLVTQFRSQLTGDVGRIAKEERAMQADILQDAAMQKSPLLGLLAGAFPSVTKRLAKNPTALPALMQLLQNMGGSEGQLSLLEPGSNGSRGSVSQRLKNQT